MKHVNSGAVDERRVHANTIAERHAHRTHANDHVQVGLDSVEHEVEYGLVVLFNAILFGLFQQVVLNLNTTTKKAIRIKKEFQLENKN